MRRLAIAEAPIDALSLAVLEDMRADTLYVATGGGMGPGTIEALTEILDQIAATSDAMVASAVDANTAGDRYATRHAELAADAGVPFARLRPPEGLDWNASLPPPIAAPSPADPAVCRTPARPGPSPGDCWRR